MARTTRTRLVATIALGGTLTLAGCSVASPITTAKPYAPSDGIRVAVTDEVSVENLMILTDGEGEEGHLLGAVVNRSGERVEVSFSFEGGGSSVPVRVGAGEHVNFTEAGITVPGVDAAPGATVATTVSEPAAGGTDVQVPVLDGTIPPYDEFLDEA
ncbi:hypothetical protein [Georgenia sp. SUBG003]|uniref:hypothetical protein n=1 Tax=Georgenia sp. SUBG003 TaxID=1497974 RepID=UPI0004D3AA36|nr:hypothetical protein DA06_05445 [Georgenia sp. SUBG003]